MNRSAAPESHGSGTEQGTRGTGLFDVTGRITVRDPYGLQTNLGKRQHDVTLVVKERGK